MTTRRLIFIPTALRKALRKLRPARMRKDCAMWFMARTLAVS